MQLWIIFKHVGRTIHGCLDVKYFIQTQVVRQYRQWRGVTVQMYIVWKYVLALANCYRRTGVRTKQSVLVAFRLKTPILRIFAKEIICISDFSTNVFQIIYLIKRVFEKKKKRFKLITCLIITARHQRTLRVYSQLILEPLYW